MMTHTRAALTLVVAALSAASAWRTQVVASFAGVTWLFSGAGPYHTLGTSDAGLQLGPVGRTLSQELDHFWNGGPPERVQF